MMFFKPFLKIDIEVTKVLSLTQQHCKQNLGSALCIGEVGKELISLSIALREREMGGLRLNLK